MQPLTCSKIVHVGVVPHPLTKVILDTTPNWTGETTVILR